MFPAWLDTPLSKMAAPGARIPHALLLHGQAGIGKRDLGLALARTLLCENDPSTKPRGGCGVCSGCLWFDRGNHPDFRRVTSDALALEAGIEAGNEAAEGDGEEVDDTDKGNSRSKAAPSKQIRIGQVSALRAFVSVATHRGRYRVVFLSPLEAVNEDSANAFLKMLEEPPPETVFILVADHIGRIKPTILSRCGKVFVPTPSREMALEWLKARGVADADALLTASGGAPFAALRASTDEDTMQLHRQFLHYLARPTVDDALSTAEAFAKVAPALTVRWMQQWMADCIGMRMAARIRYHPAHSDVIAALVARAHIEALLAMDQHLLAIRRTVDHPLNTRLMLEGLLLAYADAMAGAVARSDPNGPPPLLPPLDAPR